MGRFISKSLVHMSFAGAGSDTIAIDDDHIGLVTYLDLSASATRNIRVQVGTNDIWRGWVGTTPVQLNFGQIGRGAGNAAVPGDDVTVTVDGECEVFIGLRQIEKS